MQTKNNRCFSWRRQSQACTGAPFPLPPYCKRPELQSQLALDLSSPGLVETVRKPFRYRSCSPTVCQRCCNRLGAGSKGPPSRGSLPPQSRAAVRSSPCVPGGPCPLKPVKGRGWPKETPFLSVPPSTLNLKRALFLEALWSH